MYCVGWSQTGSVGVISNTVESCQIAFEKFKQDLYNQYTDAHPIIDQIESDSIVEQLRAEYISHTGKNVVDINDWCKINNHEIEHGILIGKEREIVEDLNKYDAIIHRL